MTDYIVESMVHVEGVRTNDDVTKCLQSLYDMFAKHGLGQATFEVTEGGTKLFIKHKSSVPLDVAAVDQALREAGNYSVLAGE